MNLMEYIHSTNTGCTGSNVMAPVEGKLGPNKRALHWCQSRPNCGKACVMFSFRNAAALDRLLKVEP